ncbi:hypothetical protein Tco_0948708, partial [Tanacetum coccineum]
GLDYRRAVDGKHMSEPDFEIQVQEPPSINFADTQHVAGCFFPPECRTTARLHGARAHGDKGLRSAGLGQLTEQTRQIGAVMLSVVPKSSRLVPKSGAAINSTDSGRCNVVVPDGYEGVCGVGPSVPSKQQSIRVHGLCRVMATIGKTNNTCEEKGKMIMTEPEITAIADLRPTHCNKTIEAVVYPKWTSRHVYTRQPTKYCCILIDKQANMNVKDAEYFNQLLPLHRAYKISGFSCEQTGLWERTLDNPTSLIFGKFINLEEIPSHDFPEHYFNFASYNELLARADVEREIFDFKCRAHTSPLCGVRCKSTVLLDSDSTGFALMDQQDEGRDKQSMVWDGRHAKMRKLLTDVTLPEQQSHHCIKFTTF